MWLKGSSTWLNIVDDLIKLMCGEIADGASNTVPIGDRWTRIQPTYNTVKSPSSTDFTMPNMSNRAGYCTMLAPDSNNSICRVTNIFTSNPGSLTKWCWAAYVSTVNSVASNYSTAQITWRVFNIDTGATVSSGTVTLNAGGVGSGANMPNGLQITCSGTNGFLTSGATWARCFTSTFVGGIDWFGPSYARRRADATFSVTPTGAQPADWDLISNVASQLGGTTLFIAGSPFQFRWPQCGQMLQGLGIKTNTGLSGNLYTFSYNCAMHTFDLQAGTGGAAGQIRMDAQVDCQSDGALMQLAVGGFFVSGAWLRPYQTPGSVTNASQIQYWMSVKKEKIVIILNADPAQSGKSTCNWIATQTPIFPGYDKMRAIWGGAPLDYTADTTSSTSRFDMQDQWDLFSQLSRQDGSENRDWQTGWLRADTDPQRGGWMLGYVDAHNLSAWGWFFDASGAGASSVFGAPDSQEKPLRYDNKWWLYGVYWTDAPLKLSGPTSSQNSVNRIIRGYLPSGVFFTPAIGWNSGDELTDTDTGDVYFLMAADYHGVGGRYKLNTNLYAGGAAILEE